MRGSNNETRAAIKDNFESFDLTCSWLASDFDAGKIEKQKAILISSGKIKWKVSK